MTQILIPFNTKQKFKVILRCLGDSLAYHNGRPFSTKDRDNDAWPNNCAVRYHGAWWLGACHHSNLNGRYRSVGPGDENGVDWRRWKNAHYSMKRASMKIRPN